MITDDVYSDMKRLGMVPRMPNGQHRGRPRNLFLKEGARSTKLMSTPKATAVQIQKRYSYEQVREFVLGMGHNPYTLMALWDCSKQSALTVIRNALLPEDLRTCPWKSRRFFELCYAWDLNAAEVIRLMDNYDRADTENPVAEHRAFKGVMFRPGVIRKPRELLKPSFIDEALRADIDIKIMSKLTRYSIPEIKQLMIERGMARQYDQLLVNSTREVPVKTIPVYMQYKFFKQGK